MKWVPHRYQIRAVKFLLAHPAAGLLLDPGLGKTSIVLQALSVLQKHGVADKALVIAPLQVALNVWRQEAALWDQFQHLRVSVLHGPKKEQALAEDADVYVINPEGLPWLVKQKWQRPDMLVVDESTKFKNTQTKRFKLLRPWLHKFDRRIILTGTPVPNGLIDLFGQLYILDLGHRLGEYITHYRTRYFIQTGYGGYEWRPHPDAEERIYKKIEDICLRMEGSDYLDLPDKILTPVRFDLPRKARVKYEVLAAEFMAEVDGGTVIASNAAVASGKLRQVVNGAVYGSEEDAGKALHLHDVKLDIVEDLVEEIGAPTVIAYEFRHDLARLLQRFPHASVIGGGIAKSKVNAAIEEWNQGLVPQLLIHPAAAGHGLNLQAGGHHLIWFGLPWNLEHYDQTIARLWRQGQKRPTFVYHILARDTVDEVVLKVLQMKDRTQRSLLAALKKSGRKK